MSQFHKYERKLTNVHYLQCRCWLHMTSREIIEYPGIDHYERVACMMDPTTTVASSTAAQSTTAAMECQSGAAIQCITNLYTNVSTAITMNQELTEICGYVAV